MLKNVILSVVCGLLWVSPAQADVKVADGLARAVTLPRSAARIAPAGPPAEVLLYVVAPDLMAGWARQQPDAVLRQVSERARTLPVLGHLTGWEGEPDYSKWKTAGVDLFVDYGSINGRFEVLADTVQAATGVPYVVLDGRLEKTPDTFRILGQLTGRTQRAEVLAKTAERILARAEAARTLPRLYVARSADGRSTMTARSQHGEIFSTAGAANVAVRENDITDQELLAWQPGIIVALDPAFRSVVATAPWAQLPAVKNNRVLTAPSGPWSWMCGPPSVNRLLGLVWLSAAVSDTPDWPAAKAEAATLYQQLYGCALSASELDAVFAP